MACAEPGGADHQPQTFGTALSIGLHVMVAVVILSSALRAPEPIEIASVPVALGLPGVTRPGDSGRVGGSGMEGAGERPRRPGAAVTPAVAMAVSPADLRPVAIPALMVDAPTQLPGSAVGIDAIGRGIGPGAGDQPGSGAGGPGSGAGPGADGGSGDEGVGAGDGVTGPQLIHEVRPAYTAEAMRAKVQGQVELDVVVMADGTIDPRRIRIARSLDSTFGLDGQAIAAVKQWRFRPGRYRGRPVAVPVRVELTFTLR